MLRCWACITQDYFLFILSLKFYLTLDKPANASVSYVSGLYVRKINYLKEHGTINGYLNTGFNS